MIDDIQLENIQEPYESIQRRLEVVLNANGGKKTLVMKYCLFPRCSHCFVQALYVSTSLNYLFINEWFYH